MADAPVLYQLHAALPWLLLRGLAVQPPRPRLELPAPVPRPPVHPLPQPVRGRPPLTPLHVGMRSLSALVDELAAAVPPASGATVMGTGIVSIGLSLDGSETLSRILLVVAGARLDRARPAAARARVPAATAADRARTLPRSPHRDRGHERARRPAGAARLEPRGRRPAGDRPSRLARSSSPGCSPTGGVRRSAPRFVLTVATESLAVLGSALALAYGASWLAVAALACVGLGLAFYLFVVSAFDLRQLLVGRGDHWVSGGALAIAALACARTADAAGVLHPLRSASASLATAALGIWAAAFVWLPALLLGELVSRRAAYDVRRWSTVFPVGMYAACSFAVAKVEAITGIEHFARVWVWVAFAVWLAVFAGMLRRIAVVLASTLAPADRAPG